MIKISFISLCRQTDNMSLFNSLLQSIKHGFEKENNTKKEIIKTIKEIINTTIQENSLKIKDKKLTILTTPTIKMAINLKKDLILNSFKSNNIDINQIN